MANAYFYSSTAVQTTLTGGISNSSLTAQVASTVGWPSSYPYVIAIDYGAAAEELCTVTNNSAGVLTITRAFDSTSAQSHGIGAVVRHVYCANDATAFRTHEAAVAAVHGVAGTIVGTTDSQTLTNKILTSPTINAGALSGTFTGAPTFSGAVVLSGTPTISGAAISGTWTATNPTFLAAASTSTPLTIQAAASQSVDLFAVSNSTPTKMVRVLQDGRTIVAPTNATATSFTINGPTGTTGDLIDLQVNGSTFMSVTSGQNIQFFPAGATSEILGSQVVAIGSFDMVRFRADGRFDWGPGTGARDTNLYRNGTGILKTDTQFVAGTGVSVPNGQSSFVSSIAGTSPLVVDGPTGLPTTSVAVFKANGAQVATVDTNGAWNGGINIPAGTVGYTATVYKAADTSRASTTTISSDPDLLFGSGNFVSGGVYKITGYIWYNGAAVGTADLKMTLALTSGTINTAVSSWNFGAPATTAINSLQAVASPLSTTAAYGTGGGNTVGAHFEANFTTTSIVQVAIQWAQNTSNATATILKAGSYLTLTRIA